MSRISAFARLRMLGSSSNDFTTLQDKSRVEYRLTLVTYPKPETVTVRFP